MNVAITVANTLMKRAKSVPPIDARWWRLQKYCRLVVDCVENPMAARYVAAQPPKIREQKEWPPLHVVEGVLNHRVKTDG